jgi:hypothetical protein
MNAQDLARLELAKRAYRAAEPRAAEIQTGVRRARIWLRRPKPRRSWFSKGLVMVVLAVGSLAYAKPHELVELVTQALPMTPRPYEPASRIRAATPPPAEAGALTSPVEILPERRSAADERRVVEAPAAPARVAAEPITPSAKRAPARPEPARAPDRPEAATLPELVTSVEPPVTAVSEPATEWGRVGQALARGDEQRALSALAELSESADLRTRDKADLGRAQLLRARGSEEEACALARSLTQRRAGSRIERQALLLLKGCTR